MKQRYQVACVCVVFLALWIAACGSEGKAGRKEVDLTIRQGALPAEQRLIRVSQGDDVVLRLSTDAPLTVHLHGYDIEKELKPGAVTTVWLVATATGRFPITRHGGGGETPLAYLEVQPR
jgi:hypothetical protein